MTFGEKLRKLMKARGIKAITLAQRMGVSCAYVSQIITGIRRPGRETLLKLSKSLEIPLETLLMIETDISDRIPISRKIPVLDDVKIQEWSDCLDLDYPTLVASVFEYGTTDDPNAFYITPKGLLSSCGLEEYDLILIEPGKKVASGDTVFVWSPQGVSIRKFLVKKNMIVLVDDKQEPIVFKQGVGEENLKFYRVSQCLRRF